MVEILSEQRALTSVGTLVKKRNEINNLQIVTLVNARQRSLRVLKLNKRAFTSVCL